MTVNQTMFTRSGFLIAARSRQTSCTMDLTCSEGLDSHFSAYEDIFALRCAASHTAAP